MWNFQYKHGDRPLAGFTIERAAGRGGFGEVYFAVSDTGRQVALKAVQGYEQIELRGISQCMNLKNPHLVTIFDVRFNDLGKPFVIMEFVGGPSLRQLLDESPSGLGPQKTAFFLREIGKGLSYLHENGIVHRDLKPGNIFYENGYVKIGDYGLSKLIAPMQNSAQTVTVGTVHYMAPEIGAGKYDRSIDIYALGAVVYEMLAGQVPFIGASPTEVLIKHLSTEPDLTGIPEPFATVIKKAMAKDPAKRYQSVQEMVEAVFGTEHIRQSVSVFSPEELSMVAAQATKQVALGSGGNGGSDDFRNAGAAAAVAEGSSAPAGGGKAGGANDRFGKWANRFGDRISQAADCVAARGGEIAEQMAAGNRGGPAAARGNAADGIVDVMDCRNRRILASIVAVFTGFAAQIFAHRHGANDLFLVFLTAWTMVLGGAIGINKAARQLPLKIPGERDKTARHLLTGGLAMLFATIFSGFFWFILAAKVPGIDVGGTFLAIVIPLFFMDATAWVKPDRRERVKIVECAVECAIFAGVLSMFLHSDPGVAIPILVGICIASQLLAPWSGVLREVRKSAETGPPEGGPSRSTSPQTRPIPRTAAGLPLNNPPMQPMQLSPIHPFARIAWLVGTVLTFSYGLTLLIAYGTIPRPKPAMVPFGIYFLLASVICLGQTLRQRWISRWRNFGRPVSLLISLAAVALCIAIMATDNNDSDDVIDIFVLTICSITSLVIFCIPGRSATFGLSQVAGSPIPPNGPPMPFVPLPPIRPMAWIIWPVGVILSLLVGIIGLHKFRNGDSFAAFIPFAIAIFIFSKLVRMQSRINRGDPLTRPTLDRHSGRMWDYTWHLRNVVAFFSSILVLGSIIFTLVVAMHATEALADGLPNHNVYTDLNARVFAGYPAWPELLSNLAFIAAVLLALLGLAGKIFVRRAGGIWHILRGIVGMGVLMSAVFVAGSAFHPSAWMAIADLVNANRQPAAWAAFLDGFERPPLIAAGADYVLAMLLLAWPPRRQTVMATPAPAIAAVSANAPPNP